MRVGRKPAEPARRPPRAEAFRSRDLVRELRGPLAPFLKDCGFRRLGERGWVRPHDDAYLMIAIQCSQSGWESRAGNRFILEFEVSSRAALASSLQRQRLWGLLDDEQRIAAAAINDAVAVSLPEPDPAFLAVLPENVATHYLQQFGPRPLPPENADVWFQYYDEADAARWGVFLGDVLGGATERFLREPPSFLGRRPE